MTRTIVIGGGIAGLSAAWSLARDREVLLLERESMLSTHSSARNAQIWLPIDDDQTTGPLARLSAQRLSALLGSEAAWLRRSGAVVLVDAKRVDSVCEGAARGGVRARRLTSAELRERAPEVRAPGLAALFVDGAGVFEPHVMTTALAAAGRDAGVSVQKESPVRELVSRAGAIAGVILGDGRELECDEVVIAAGAWAGALGASVGAPVPLVPLRRHLVVLETAPRSTTVWSFGEPEVYWRAESGGVLACPCDEVVVDPCLPPADPSALELLAERLAVVAPELVSAPVRTSWACLRTYAHDRELVVGPDPRVEGLAWVAGLGGRGMTVGVGAGELCARAMRGERDPLIERMRPDRVQPEVLDPA